LMRRQARVTRLIAGIQNSLTLMSAKFVRRRFALDCLAPIYFAGSPALDCPQA